jgi:uncharacterized protein (DUF433 family)
LAAALSEPPVFAPWRHGNVSSDVLELLAAGAGIDEILSDYPFLEREDIFAAVEYAARQTDLPS